MCVTIDAAPVNQVGVRWPVGMVSPSTWRTNKQTKNRNIRKEQKKRENGRGEEGAKQTNFSDEIEGSDRQIGSLLGSKLLC